MVIICGFKARLIYFSFLWIVSLWPVFFSVKHFVIFFPFFNLVRCYIKFNLFVLLTFNAKLYLGMSLYQFGGTWRTWHFLSWFLLWKVWRKCLANVATNVNKTDLKPLSIFYIAIQDASTAEVQMNLKLTIWLLYWRQQSCAVCASVTKISLCG